MAFEHTPVLLNEVLSFAPSTLRLAVDCTVGGGGHARALLAARPTARLIGLDRDPEAIAAAGATLREFGDRVCLVRAPFSALSTVVGEVGWGAPDFVLADLGVSSHQLDQPRRGFSFQADGPLDMRMDPDDESAAALLARLDEHTLAQAVFELGGERHSRRVARAVVAGQPTTTGELAALVRRVVPRAKDGIDPATRTFQAVRILVNHEDEELGAWLTALPSTLAPEGVAVVISFHSGEDRAVKDAFRRAARDCTCPPEYPACMCGGRNATLEVLTGKPMTAGPNETATNARSRSAKLRAARRLGGEP